MYYCYLESPIGELLLAGDDDALTMIGFPKGAMRRDPEGDWIYNEKPFAEAVRQLKEYFAGERHEFDLPLRLDGTEFQLLVLDELRRIPYGETTSYGAIAARIGRPKAVRAVGAANGDAWKHAVNPIDGPGTAARRHHAQVLVHYMFPIAH